MTILVGVLCGDGSVVIGSDSSATLSDGRNNTIEQPVKKIEVIGGKVIMAGTGAVGLGQRFSYQIDNAWKNNQFRGHYTDVGKALCAAGVKDFSSTNASKGEYGALMAFPVEKKPYLCEFSLKDFQPEFKTHDIWYVAMGCGQQIVDPFLGLMRKVFCPDGPPDTYGEGLFITLWALQQAIELNAGGINGPIQIAVLKKDSGELQARLYDPNDLKEHEQAVS